MRKTYGPLVWAFGAIAALASCDDGQDPAGPGTSRLSIVEEVIHLQPGEEAELTLEGVSAGAVAWEVRHPGVVDLPAEGVIRGLAPGMTWAVARSSTDVDSVRVAVSFVGTPSGTIAFSLGTEEEPLELTGVSRIYRTLVGGIAWTNVTASVSAEDPAELHIQDFFAGQDTVVLLRVDAEPEPGFRRFAPWELLEDAEGRFRLHGAEGAMVWIRDPDHASRAQLFVPVDDIELEIDSSDEPALMGPPTGRLVGRVAFEAAGLIVEFGAAGTHIVGQVSTETTQVFAEFDVAQRVEPIGLVETTVAGGPYPADGVRAWAPRVGLWEGGLLVNTIGRTADGGFYTSQVWLGTPGEGEFTVDALTVEELVDRSALVPDRAWIWTESVSLEDRIALGHATNLGLSSGGSMRITRYEAPGEQTWGILEATVEALQPMVFGGEPGASQAVELEIVAPISPTSETVYPVQPTAVVNREEPEVEPGTKRVGNGPLALPGEVLETMATKVPEVEVTLSWSGGSATVRTNADGGFTFTGLHEGTYEIAFELPDGHGLAQWQRQPVGPITVTADRPQWIPIYLSDAEGNGSLRVGTGILGSRRVLDGVEIRIRREGTSEVVKVLRTGADHPAPGVAVGKILPGRYELDFVPPPGYRLADGEEASVAVEIFRGRMRPVFVRLVEE